MRSFRAALVVTRDYAEDGSGLERLAFTSSLNRFEAELDAVEVGGGGNGFCAFNTGMGDALGPDMGWRTGVRRLIIVATAGIPHAIGEKQDEDEVEGYTISRTPHTIFGLGIVLIESICSFRPYSDGSSHKLAWYRSRFPY